MVIFVDMFQFPKNKEDWLLIADVFEKKWNFINCGGAMDGKHIRIAQPPNTGAYYYNYKNFYSIVLMAIVNANYEFIFVDVGKNGRMSDGGVIEYTEFFTRLQSNRLNLPTNHETKNNLNFVFLGDEAFALGTHFLKPFPQKELTHERRIFNYRLARARNVSENAFGLVNNRFRVLNTSINMSPKKVSYIVLAICSLHNFLIKISSSYVSPSTFDNGNINEIPREWRAETNRLVNLQPCRPRNVCSAAVQNRNNYMVYFNNDGKVSWQDDMLRKGCV